MNELRKTLSVWRGTALLINIVLGAGLLVLPGLAVQHAGRLALTTWLACALASLPLLLVFIVLGQRYPHAGGMAHFASQAFGRWAYIAASLIFLGAILFGLPSIALTGGYYAAGAFGGAPHLYAAGLLLSAFLLDVSSIQLAGKLNQWLSWCLVACITAIAVLSLRISDGLPLGMPPEMPHTLDDYRIIISTFPMVFFAFTGWEVGASLGSEFKHPRRDFPLAMLYSFGIAALLYAAMAYAAQSLPLYGQFKRPFSLIIQRRFGPAGGAAVSLAALILVFSNLSSALWGVSRLVYSLAQEAVLPSIFARLKRDLPVDALMLITLILLCVVSIDGLGWINIADSLKWAGQNFFILYGLAALALFKLSQHVMERILATAAYSW